MSRGWLLDTNIVSELFKGARGDPSVIGWVRRADESALYLSVITIGLALSFRIDGGVLTLVGQGGHDETAPEDFLDGDELTARVRRIVADMAGSGKTKVVEALMERLGWNKMTARRQLEAAVPTGGTADCAAEFDGGRLWFEKTNPNHPSSPATARFDPVSDP